MPGILFGAGQGCVLGDPRAGIVPLSRSGGCPREIEPSCDSIIHFLLIIIIIIVIIPEWSWVLVKQPSRTEDLLLPSLQKKGFFWFSFPA